MKRDARCGMTLMEVLLVLGLLGTLFGMIWGMVSLYSNHYLSGEKRIGRAQLVRSISQILADDLAAAVQDPIHPLADPTAGSGAFVRRFGLRGDATTLAIDVVEPNLMFDSRVGEDSRAEPDGKIGNLQTEEPVGGGFGTATKSLTGSTTKTAQVPELKTVFYEFVRINALEPDPRTPSVGGGGISDGGSIWVGSLATPTDLTASASPGAGIGGTGRSTQNLVRKFGLSRYELDFETPNSSDDSGVGGASGLASAKTTEGLAMIGSLATPNAAEIFGPSANAPFGGAGADELVPQNRPLSAAQLAMEVDDGTMWAPEVVDCVFRYFDGTEWCDTWNSLERNGLPVAIEVWLKLLPLDDIDELRASDSVRDITFGPPSNATPVDGSRLIGSLATPSLDELTSGMVPKGITLEEEVERLGLSPVMVRRVVAYLPTTPLSQHEIARRRIPLPAQSGRVSPRRTGGAGARNVSADPNRTPRSRTFEAREATPRTFEGRGSESRAAESRSASPRTATERPDLSARENIGGEGGRGATNRTAGGRTATSRNVESRLLSPTIPETPLVSTNPEEGRLPTPLPTVLPTAEPTAPTPSAFAGVGELSPIPPTQATPNAPFDAIDALMGGFSPVPNGGVSGEVLAPSGPKLPTQTTTNATPGTGSQPSWIRSGRSRQ